LLSADSRRARTPGCSFAGGPAEVWIFLGVNNPTGTEIGSLPILRYTILHDLAFIAVAQRGTRASSATPWRCGPEEA
jgi:hypothetical protein